MHKSHFLHYYVEFFMYITKNYYPYMMISSNSKFTNVLFVASLVPIFFALMASSSIQNAHASNFMEDILKQAQSNIQSSSNNNDCSNNVSIQTQTNENGKTTTTSKSSCGDSTSSGNTINDNIHGIIASAEYNNTTGIIQNSVYGNWSFSSHADGKKSFESSFTKQPITYVSTNPLNEKNTNDKNNIGNQLSTNTVKPKISSTVFSNKSSYKITNFVITSTQQQNSDVTYKGKVDVSQETKSSNPNVPDETNNYKSTGFTFTIIDGKTVILNFDKQSKLYQQFINTPLVGLVQ